MLWLLLLLIAAGGFAIAWRRRRMTLENWRRLRSVLGEVAEGRPPGSVVFSDPPGRFATLTPLLDRVSAEIARLRAQVTREEFNLQSILSSMQEGVMVVDARHIVRMANPSLHTLFQITHDPRRQSVLHTLREAAFDELVTAALKSNKTQSREVEISGSKPRRDVTVYVKPIRDDSGGAGAVLIFRDITRLRQLEEVRRDFVANVSHELRTPLSIFHGWLEALGDRPDMPGGEREEIYAVLRRHSRRLNALLEDLLLLARLEARHCEMQCEPIAVGELLEAVREDWALRIAKKKVTLCIDLPPGLPSIVGDRLRLEQVFSNLLDNALKYTGAGGRVGVQAALDGGRMVFTVEDSGAGIAPTDIPHIFERFYRADKARSRDQGGTGLGLSIVKHIVQAHGGSVHAASTYGKGTAIVLRLPIV